MLTEVDALRAYARMMNTLDPTHFEALLAEDFVYESQVVLQPLESKQEFLDYIYPKLKTIREANTTVFAEMGTLSAYGRVHQPCVVMAQNDRENLTALVLVKLASQLIKRLDICVTPSPKTAQRSGEYPV
ncbi:MAG: nuclear transport factor 2 family protein [Rhizobiales bacterium]|nr:nuclear transport factor 2 family protein [Hyphomicrobiales bacterium]